MRAGAIAAALAMAAGLVMPAATWAGGAKTEVHHLDGHTVTLHLEPFLKPDEVQMLRLLAGNAQALGMLVPAKGGHAAIAVSPAEGFLRGGQPVASASALGGFRTAAAARNAAIAHCDAAKARGPGCVVVLEAAP